MSPLDYANPADDHDPGVIHRRPEGMSPEPGGQDEGSDEKELEFLERRRQLLIGREQALDARERELEQREDEFAVRENELALREAQLVTAIEIENEGLLAREHELDELEQRLARRERQVADFVVQAQRQLTQTPATAAADRQRHFPGHRRRSDRT